MNKYLQYFTVIAFAALIGGCESYAKFAIDKEPAVKIDSSLLGSWKAVEDTDKQNFILVQSSYDNFRHIARWHNMDSSEKRKFIYAETTDTALARRVWESELDKGEPNYYEHYYRFLKENNSVYYITYFDDHGINPHYQQFGAFISAIKGSRFLNFPGDHNYFVRLIYINTTKDSITTAVVNDTTLKSLGSEKEIRRRIAENIDNPVFYSDTVHFCKVNDYHLTLNEAVERANK